MQRRDAWIYADMAIAELEQRRDALISLISGTTGAKQRRYIRELDYVQCVIDTRSIQMVLFDLLE